MIYINGKNAKATWGISFDQSALSSLMTPPPNKPLIENKSRALDGKEILGISKDEQALYRPRIDSRELSLVFNIVADSEEEFMVRYSKFCEELAKGYMEIKTDYQPDVLYRLVYKDCRQFSQFRRRIGKFTLQVEEPNPQNREL